ncbi:MAG: hypothetical protein NXI16_09990 [Alphaproteobacteria bacterium]|nr:hypothetical protein [Alphaproteobacteria bacterium]
MAATVMTAVVGCGAPLPVFERGSVTPAVDALVQTAGEGVRVEVPSGLSDRAATALAEDVAEALRGRGVPAAVAAGNRLSSRLAAKGRETGDGPDVIVDLIWTLTDARGEAIASRTDAWRVPAREWREDGDSLIAGIAAETAKTFADRIVGTDEARPLVVGLGPVDGVEQAGETALLMALRRGLLAQSIAVSVDPAEITAQVTGEIDVIPIDQTRELVRIDWIVSTADGRELGRLGQETPVKPGVLEANWSESAYFIAQGVLPDLIGVIRKSNPRSVYTGAGD